jgi:hypothetical protein
MSRVLYQYDLTGGLRDPLEMALGEFERIHETHHPRPLPDEVLTELHCILAMAEGEVGD